MAAKGSVVTRDQIAKAAGVSAATVSYVVNNGPRPVSEETRRRVLAVIESMGYTPNVIARNLRLQRSNTIGLIIPDTNNPYFAQVARGVEQMATENGLTTVLCHSSYSLEAELRYVETLRSERAAGIIWFPATNSAEPALRIAEYGLPLVVLDRMTEGIPAAGIVADNYRGGICATEHLIGLGHRLIGCIARPTDLHHSSDRVRGYREALARHGCPTDEALIARGGFRLEDGYEAARRLLQVSPRPTGIFAYNDLMAIGALRAAYDLGLHVPTQLSIIGFDDIPEAAFTCPALTTISQPKLEMGRDGVGLLLDLIHERPVEAGHVLTLPVQLIIRESTGPHT
jgi:LacI family transcriptional regulator